MIEEDIQQLQREIRQIKYILMPFIADQIEWCIAESRYYPPIYNTIHNPLFIGTRKECQQKIDGPTNGSIYTEKPLKGYNIYNVYIVCRNKFTKEIFLYD